MPKEPATAEDLPNKDEEEEELDNNLAEDIDDELKKYEEMYVVSKSFFANCFIHLLTTLLSQYYQWYQGIRAVHGSNEEEQGATLEPGNQKGARSNRLH